jgi:hypothetical protein
MKINSIGISAYQQAIKQNAVSRQPQEIERADRARQPEQVSIPGQGGRVNSRVSVKLKGNRFLELLSSEEQQALGTLFKKFGDKSMAEIVDFSGQNNLGNFIDVKL